MRHFVSLAPFALLGVLLYLNTLDGELIFDDRVAIVENADLRPSSPWSNLLVHDYWGEDVRLPRSHKSYRPLTSASFKLNYHLHRLEPRGYHLGNVILHGTVCYLFALFSTEAFGRTWPVFISSLHFAVHPIHTDAVAGVVGRAEILCALFYLASLLSYRRSLQNTGSHKWLLASVVFCLCSFLSKEQGITVLPVCLAYHLFIHSQVGCSSAVRMLTLQLRQGKLSRDSGTFLNRAILLGTMATATLLVRLWFMRQGPSFGRADNPAQTLPFPYKQLYLLHLVVVNIWLLFSPSRLLQDWRLGAVPLVDSLADIRNLLTLVSIVSLCVLVTRGGNGRQGKILLFGLAFSALSFLPASNLLFLVGFVVAERVLYIPSMGFCVVVSHAVWLLVKASTKGLQTVWICACVLLLMAQGVKTIVRNSDWQNGLTMNTASIRTYPGNGLMYSNLGLMYHQMGNDSLAEALHRAAVKMVPQYSQTHRNYGALLQQQGHYQEAEEVYNRALELIPVHSRRSRTVETYYALANVIVAQNKSRFREAEVLLERAVSLNPSLPGPHYAKGKFLLAMNRPSKAIGAFHEASKLDPMLKDPYHQLGLAYMQAGVPKKAEESFRKVFSLDPGNAEAALELGVLLSESQDREKIMEAKRFLQAFLRAEPNVSRAWYHLGLAHLKLENFLQAEASFLYLLQRDPTNEMALLQLGSMYHSQGDCPRAVGYLRKLAEDHPNHSVGKKLLLDCYRLLYKGTQ